jgi:hypothetical protein
MLAGPRRYADQPMQEPADFAAAAAAAANLPPLFASPAMGMPPREGEPAGGSPQAQQQPMAVEPGSVRICQVSHFGLMTHEHARKTRVGWGGVGCMRVSALS